MAATDFPPPFPDDFPLNDKHVVGSEPEPDPIIDEVRLKLDQPDSDLEQFYTTTYVANLFSVKPETVIEWIKTDQLRAIKITGGRWRIPKAAILDFANKRFTS